MIPPQNAPVNRIATPEDLRRVTGASFTVSDEQWEAISANPEPGVVIAGAGSGKTELMSARVIYLVANGFVRADEVLGLTFTTKATAELSHRIRAALANAGLDRGEPAEDGGPGELLEPTVSTYNAYASGLLRDHGLRIGHEPDMRVLGDAARYQLAQRVIAGHRGDVSKLSNNPSTVISKMLALDGAMGEHLVEPAQLRAFQTVERPIFAAELADLESQKRTIGKQKTVRGVLETMDERAELLELVEAYRAAKRELRVMDFSDQIVGACAIAAQFPEVAAGERQRFKVVLLDEYQDTSVAQAVLLSTLFSGETPDEGRGHAVTAVGDPNQAIYGWRGASVANIAGFREQFPLADGSPSNRFSLTVNRRSDSRILDVANALAHPLLIEQAGLVEPLRAKPEAELGIVRTAVHATEEEELAWLVDEVKAAHQRLAAEALAQVPELKVAKRFEEAREAEARARAAWREIGILVRTNAGGALAHDALSAAGIPVEIVGLGGLVQLPEIAQVVATLRLLENVADNASLLTLLAGPRWEIGPRDLALLGRRSQELARAVAGEAEEKDLLGQLVEAVSGADATELASLNEALVSPGDHPYSSDARQRFARLASELEYLRSHVGESLSDLVRRVVDAMGIDVELASSVSPAATTRRDNLDIFMQVVSDFTGYDGTSTLSAFNAWLSVEEGEGNGLEMAPPSDADSVKILTIHRSKGLEYDVVFMFGVADKKLPSRKVPDHWISRAEQLPSTLRGDADSLPQLEERSHEGVEEFKAALKEHQGSEDLRLGYVAFTRARHEFVVSSHVWSSLVKPLEPSPYMVTARTLEESWDVELAPWYLPEEDEENPVAAQQVRVPWPAGVRTAERELREEAAARVVARIGEFDEGPQKFVADAPEEQYAEFVELEGAAEDESAAQTLARWDESMDVLLAEARARRSSAIVIDLPASLSTTALQRLRNDAEAYAIDLLRPMPRPPAPAARYGTEFHAWVEARFEQQMLLDPEDLPGSGDAEIADAVDLTTLQKAFEAGPFAERRPHAVEAPFSLSLGSHVIRGRIDAVFTEPDGEDGRPRWLVVDWKTNRVENADPFQLAVYKQAWAELAGVDPDQVRAAFHYVRSGRTVAPDSLASKADLLAVLEGKDASR